MVLIHLFIVGNMLVMVHISEAKQWLINQCRDNLAVSTGKKRGPYIETPFLIGRAYP